MPGKLYGKYLQNLVSHQPIQLRLISGDSSNAEDEERIFNAIKGITKSTSNNKASHVIPNLLLPLQAEEEDGSGTGTTTKQQNNISKLDSSLQQSGNTKVLSCILDDPRLSRWWQAHLERISDFLLPGEGVVEVSPREWTGGVFGWRGKTRLKEGRPSIASLPITKPQAGGKLPLPVLADMSPGQDQSSCSLPPAPKWRWEGCKSNYLEEYLGNEQPMQDGKNDGDMGDEEAEPEEKEEGDQPGEEEEERDWSVLGPGRIT